MINYQIQTQIVPTVGSLPIFQDQKLEGSFVLPPPIDSVCLNGNPVPDTIVIGSIVNDSFANLHIDSLVFTWKSINYDGYFSISYNKYQTISVDNLVTSNTWFKCPIAKLPLFIDFTLSTHLGRRITNNSVPDNSNNGLFVYYDIPGTTYSKRIDFKIALSKETKAKL
jgi:hypothetical protein